jgi:hypothetical protein
MLPVIEFIYRMTARRDARHGVYTNANHQNPIFNWLCHKTVERVMLLAGLRNGMETCSLARAKGSVRWRPTTGESPVPPGAIGGMRPNTGRW